MGVIEFNKIGGMKKIFADHFVAFERYDEITGKWVMCVYPEIGYQLRYVEARI
jgi:hypothetical protein